MFKLKEKNKLCRKYMQDIWGNFIRKKKINKVIIYLLKLKQEKRLRYKPFVLDIKSSRPLARRKVRTRFCKNLDTIKKLTYFCGGFRKKRLKSMLSIAKRQKGFFMDNFFSLLELRLINIVFRMNICCTILEGMQLIYAGYILVNKEVIKNINHYVKVGSCIEVINYKREELYKLFVDKKKKKEILVYNPTYLYINYEILLCIVLSVPNTTFIKYPFKVQKQFGYMISSSRL